MGDVSHSNVVASLPNASGRHQNNELEQLVLGALEEVNTTRGRESDAFKPGVVEARSSETSGVRCSVLGAKSPLNSSLTNDTCPRGQVQANHHGDNTVSEANLINQEAERLQGTPHASLPIVEIPLGGTEFVVIEQHAVEHISRYLSQSASHTIELVDKNEATATEALLNESQSENAQYQLETKENSVVPTSTSASNDSFWKDDCVTSGDEEELNTLMLAQQLTNELKKYSIPQAVFAKKVLNRSQGTLSDILRKPKPWQELKGGKEIFKKMKEWLELPAVKRIPQLRTEAAKELDMKLARQSPRSDDPPAKKQRLHFSDSQKRALYAIFKETRKPSREMQIALAEELGLQKSTVSNFFMNARRRHPEPEE